MKTFTFYELVEQLNGGAIIPVGETIYDKRAYERMVEIEGLAMNLIEDIGEIAEMKNKEASIRKASEEAIRWLKEVKVFIDEAIEESYVESVR